MFKYTKHTLKKTEDLFKAIQYTIRYERGSFKSGYCIVENRKIAVINKFFDTEARINCLLEILPTVEVDIERLDDKTAEFYKKLMQNIKRSNEEDEAEEIITDHHDSTIEEEKANNEKTTVESEK